MVFPNHHRGFHIDHSLIWALLLVAIIGPGILAGLIAIAIRSIGFCAKLFYDVTLRANRQCALRDLTRIFGFCTGTMAQFRDSTPWVKWVIT